MRVLNVEDEAMKHRDICKVLKNSGVNEITWSKTLDEGMKLIKESMENRNLFDVIITDMYYPIHEGERETESGEMLIQKLEELKIEIPIILCSSIKYKMQNLFGVLHYSNSENWEEELKSMIEKIHELNTNN